MKAIHPPIPSQVASTAGKQRAIRIMLGLVLLGNVSPLGAQTIELSLHQNGELTWTNASEETLFYEVQWIPRVANTSADSWQLFKRMAASGNSMTTDVPMVFRVASYPRIPNATRIGVLSDGGMPVNVTTKRALSRFVTTVEDSKLQGDPTNFAPVIVLSLYSIYPGYDWDPYDNLLNKNADILRQYVHAGGVVLCFGFNLQRHLWLPFDCEGDQMGVFVSDITPKALDHPIFADPLVNKPFSIGGSSVTTAARIRAWDDQNWSVVSQNAAGYPIIIEAQYGSGLVMICIPMPAINAQVSSAAQTFLRLIIDYAFAKSSL